MNEHEEVLEGIVSAFRRALDFCDAEYTEVRPGVAAGWNLAEFIREALEALADERGGATQLIRHRPGCWEADPLMALLGFARTWDRPSEWSGPGIEGASP